MLSDAVSSLELRQDEAVSQAFFADELLQAGRVLGVVCVTCGQPISAARVGMFPRTTVCGICSSFRYWAKSK